MGGRQPQGFTIIEIMIFLAVSGVIFASAMILMSGKQDKTEFSTGIAQLTSQLQNIASDVATGYYSTPNTFSCSPGTSGHPTISPSGGASRGSNFGCIFIGEVIQFYPNTPLSVTNQPYTIFPIIGNQFQLPPNQADEVTDLSDTHPYPLYQASDIAADQQALPFGITVGYMSYIDSSLSHQPMNDDCNNVPDSSCIGAVGLFTTFNGETNQAEGNTDLLPLLHNGSQDVDIVPIPGSQSDDITDENPLIDQIIGLQDSTNNNVVTDTDNHDQTYSNPTGGVQICFNSGTNSESGLVTLGGSNSTSLVTVKDFSQLDCVL